MSEEKNQVQHVGAIVGVVSSSSVPSETVPTEDSNHTSVAESSQQPKPGSLVEGKPSENLNDPDEDSEAETLIQSPEKKRNIVESAPTLQPSHGHASSAMVASAPKNDVQSRKRKRSINESHAPRDSPTPSHRSSPLSSPVANPPSDDSGSDHSVDRRPRRAERHRVRRNGARQPSAESEGNQDLPGNRRGHVNDGVGVQAHKRERHSTDMGDRRETRSATYPRHSDNERSPSPQAVSKREHKRGASTQLTSHELERKRRGRPPLISTHRHHSMERTRSPDSERSNSPAPQRTALHRSTGVEHDTMSPVKTGPKKRRDKNGRTAVARHANSGNLEMVKVALAEHHEDLNLADNAGNTPLQIAALEGHIDIVDFLLSQNCDVETRNIDKDTPLIDAVENGHVEVIKLLLDHGADPRVGNAKGDEPYELVPEDDENYDEIRRLLADAKMRMSNKQRGQELVEASVRDGNSSRAASAASPRDSPPVGPRSPPAFSSRRRTGRSESTRNDLLWQAHNQPTLTKLAGKGDVQGVANILNILQKAETESLIAAAKAGHEEVLQHLLAMGDPDPDPAPVKTLHPGYNTPLLAAIGRGHVDVVKLLISQSGIDPTRKLYGRYYFELARERKGASWQLEYEVLKNAYDRYGTNKGRKHASPRKLKDSEKIKHRLARRTPSPASQKRLSSSPTTVHRTLSTRSNESSPKEQRKGIGGTELRKTSGNKFDNGDSSLAVVSDLEQTVAGQRKAHRPRRSQSDLIISQVGDGGDDAPYRRRRLVTGKEHRRNKSSARESASEDGETGSDKKNHTQESRMISNLKRSRSSESPMPHSAEDIDKNRVGVKKRRTIDSSPEEGRSHPAKAESLATSNQQPTNGEVEQDGTPDIAPKRDGTPTIKEIAQLAGNDKLIVEGEEDDRKEDPVPTSDPEILPDADQINISRIPSDEQTTTEVQKKVVTISEGSTELDLETIGTSLEQDPGTTSVKNEDAEMNAAREAENAEAASAARDRAAAAAAEEEERRQAIRQREEEEAMQAKKLLEEQQARQRAEEDAARKREEEVRQEQQRQEFEQRRRQQDLENERKRLANLPAALRKTAALLNENDPLAREEHWLREKYLPLFTVTTQQLDSQCPEQTAHEQWVPNYQVAGLLATKDLHLRAYTSIEKRPASTHERHRLWGVSRIQLSFDYLMNWGLGISHDESIQRERENREKFMLMDEIFWVKLSDFQDQVPRYSHLEHIKLQTQAISLKKWKDVLEEAPENRSSELPSKLSTYMHVPNRAVRGTVE